MLIGRKDPTDREAVELFEAVGNQPNGVPGAGILRVARRQFDDAKYVLLQDEKGKDLTGWLTLAEATMWIDGYFTGKEWKPEGAD